MNSFPGIVPPMSDSFPNINDIENNNSLLSYLINNKIFEDYNGQNRREKVYYRLYDIVKNWVILIGKSRGYDDNVCLNGAGTLLKVYGSQRLGVHSPDADMDVLCIAPSFVSRYDFFNSFCEILLRSEDVSLVLPLPEAYTPVLKFVMNKQAVDMIFVSLSILPIPPHLDILNDNRILVGLDEQGIRSLNGYRVAERLLQLVPNVHSYCTTLAAIKHWAKRRGIYANILGFLGGVNFAILVAKVCQMHINSCPATLLKEFFKLYYQWKWPNHILLTYIEDLPLIDGVYFPSWNSKVYPADRAHLMPIITPSAPAMNSAYNVGEPQKDRILREIQRGNSLFSNWKLKCEEEGRFEPFCWEELFKSADSEFFQQYKRYLQIDVCAPTADEQRKWFGWCESRLRQLILALHQSGIVLCHPYSNCFHRRVPRTNSTENDPEATVTTTTLTTSMSSPPSSPTSTSTVISSTASNTITTTPPSNSAIMNIITENYEGLVLNTSDIDDSNFKFCSSFFMGLTFREYWPIVDFTPIIQNFLYRVCNWNGKTPTMEIHIHVPKKEDLPIFVHEEIPLPSSTSDCTPSKYCKKNDLLAFNINQYPETQSFTSSPLPAQLSSSPIGLGTRSLSPRTNQLLFNDQYHHITFDHPNDNIYNTIPTSTSSTLSLPISPSSTPSTKSTKTMKSTKTTKTTTTVPTTSTLYNPPLPTSIPNRLVGLIVESDSIPRDQYPVEHFSSPQSTISKNIFQNNDYNSDNEIENDNNDNEMNINNDNDNSNIEIDHETNNNENKGNNFIFSNNYQNEVEVVEEEVAEKEEVEEKNDIMINVLNHSENDLPSSRYLNGFSGGAKKHGSPDGILVNEHNGYFPLPPPLSSPHKRSRPS